MQNKKHRSTFSLQRMPVPKILKNQIEEFLNNYSKTILGVKNAVCEK